MLYGTKETCSEATREYATGRVLPLRTMHKVPVTVQENVEDTKI